MRRVKGAVVVELLIAAPIVATLLAGMLVVFGVALGGERALAARHEVARVTAEDGGGAGSFGLGSHTTCEVQGLSAPREMTLDEGEQRWCAMVGYDPLRELVRVRFTLKATHRPLANLGVGPSTTRCSYSESLMERRR